MMLATSLPLLPPPSSSLLPPSTDNAGSNQSMYGAGFNGTHPFHQQHSHRRHQHHKNIRNPRSTLAILSADERTISQRKLAIAMYGFSWLKPAGCAKTMLGRREEEVEREEVERQLREVEMQERVTAQMEEEERRRNLNETTGEGERDLDLDVPDADDLIEGEIDLDDEIPSAEEDLDDDDGLDEDGEDLDEGPEETTTDAQWTYDTRREPDTDTEEDRQGTEQARIGRLPGVQFSRRGDVGIPGSEFDVDEREAEALANAMLDEDEMGEVTMDDEQSHQLEGFAARDLDDDVPEAESGSGGWEHTDTELEEDEDNQESEMDISILPPAQAPVHTRHQAARRSGSGIDGTVGARIVSGNAALQQMQSQAQSGSHFQFHTPEVSSFAPNHNISSRGIGSTLLSSDLPNARNHNGYIANAGSTANASPRRTLFGLHGTTNAAAQPVSRLFTPSPAQTGTPDEEQPVRRSGRTTTRARPGGRRGLDSGRSRDSLD